MTHPGAQYLAELEASAKKATPGEWDVWREPCADKYAAVVELTEQVHCTHEFAGAVFLLNANGKCPAETGCGPTSEANATHIANASPARIAAIVEYVAAEKARADAAEADRDELKAEKWRAQHVDTMNDIASLRVALECAEATAADLTAKLQAAEAEHRFSLGLVDSAQATIASLTKQLAEAETALFWAARQHHEYGNKRAQKATELAAHSVRSTLSRLGKNEGGEYRCPEAGAEKPSRMSWDAMDAAGMDYCPRCGSTDHVRRIGSPAVVIECEVCTKAIADGSEPNGADRRPTRRSGDHHE